jgi:ribosomal protein S18 acetylase RimI-like enzyme
VGLLSNLLGFKDARSDAGAPVTVRPATPAEYEAALRLVLAPPGAAADTRAVQEFIAFTTERGIGLDGLHVALQNGKVVSAILPVISPGRTMLLLCPPVGQGKPSDAIAARVIDPVCDYGRQNGIELAQALVDPQDTALHAVLTDAGFARMAELYYLHVQPAPDVPVPPLPEGIAWCTYSPDTHALFGRAILDSYHNSLDCPALNGRRDIEDIIAGHKASGTFDPNLWFLLREGDKSLGVLLLSESARSDAVELVYLGLSAAARGRNLADLMMRQALSVVAGRKLPRLCLAVDSLNTPALKLYYRHGMSRIASKIAMLRDLGRLSSSGANCGGQGAP